MSEPLHDIDKLFHDGIEGHSEYPSKNVWDKVEAGLDKNTAVIYKKKYKTLKRAAAILLILFLGVLIYEVINRHPGKADFAGAKKEKTEQENIKTRADDKVVNKTGAENIEPENKEQNKDNSSQNIQNKSIAEKKESLPENQSPVILSTDPGKAADPGKKLVNTILDKKNMPGAVKGENYTDKQKSNNKPVNAGNLVFDIETPGKNRSGNNKLNSNTPVISASQENNNASGGQVAKREVSFTMTPAGLWKKDMTTGTRPLVTGSEQLLASYARVTKGHYTGLGKPGLSLTVYFSPNTAWSSIEDDEPHRSGGGGGRIEDHDEIERNENESVAYSGGIKLSYGLSKRVSLQTGLNYSKTTTELKPKKIYAERDNNGDIRYRIDCSSGYTYLLPHAASNPSTGDSIVANDSKNSLSYIGIPLTAEYTYSFGKFSLSASAGAQVNVLLKGKTTAVFDKGTVNQTSASSSTQGLRPTYFSALTSITGELKLNKKLSLILSPSGQFGLSPINNGASVKTRPDYLGVAAGLKLKL